MVSDQSEYSSLEDGSHSLWLEEGQSCEPPTAFVIFSSKITNNTVSCFPFAGESVIVMRNFPQSLPNSQGRAAEHRTCLATWVLGPGCCPPAIFGSVICLYDLWTNTESAFLKEASWLLLARFIRGVKGWKGYHSPRPLVACGGFHL